MKSRRQQCDVSQCWPARPGATLRLTRRANVRSYGIEHAVLRLARLWALARRGKIRKTRSASPSGSHSRPMPPDSGNLNIYINRDTRYYPGVNPRTTGEEPIPGVTRFQSWRTAVKPGSNFTAHRLAQGHGSSDTLGYTYNASINIWRGRGNAWHGVPALVVLGAVGACTAAFLPGQNPINRPNISLPRDLTAVRIVLVCGFSLGGSADK